MGADHRRGDRPGRRRAFFLLNLCVFSATVLLYLLNEFGLKAWTEHAFVQGHMNDLLAMGLLLPYSNVLLGLYTGRDLRLVRFGPIVSFALLVGLFWEYVTPFYYEKSVGDPWDVVFYVAGSLVYYGLLRIGNRNGSLLPE